MARRSSAPSTATRCSGRYTNCGLFTEYHDPNGQALGHNALQPNTDACCTHPDRRGLLLLRPAAGPYGALLHGRTLGPPLCPAQHRKRPDQRAGDSRAGLIRVAIPMRNVLVMRRADLEGARNGAVAAASGGAVIMRRLRACLAVLGLGRLQPRTRRRAAERRADPPGVRREHRDRALHQWQPALQRVPPSRRAASAA